MAGSKLAMFLKAIEWLLFASMVVIMLIVASPLLPTKGLASFYVVVSGSMEPTIKIGNLVLVRKVDPNQLIKGNIIAFTSPTNANQTVIHRITLATTNSGSKIFNTKGDNNKNADSWQIRADKIKGVYVGQIPEVGYFINWIKTPMGFIIAIGGAAIVILLLQIKKIRQGIEEEVEKRTKKALGKSSTKDSESSVNAHGKVLSVGVAILISISALGVTPSKAWALFNSQTQINGITLRVVDTIPGQCPVDSLSPDMFNHPPFSNHGVTSYQDSWLNPLFDWDAFWQSLGINAPKACTIPVAPSPFGTNFKSAPTPTIIPNLAPADTPTPLPSPTPITTPAPTPADLSSTASASPSAVAR